MAVAVHHGNKSPAGVNDETLSRSTEAVATGMQIKENECMRSRCRPRYGMIRGPHRLLSCLSKSVWCRESNQVPSVSALDGATNPESAERQRSNGHLTPPLLTDPPLPSITEVEPPMVVPKAKCNASPHPPAEDPVDVVTHHPGPNNSAPSTLVIVPS